MCTFPSGATHDLTRRGPLKRILRALVDAHGSAAAKDVHALIDAGWPGEKVSTDAGTARVYSAVKSLRQMGLGDLLVTRDDGYALAPTLVVDA